MTTALLIIDVQQALCSGPWTAFDIHNVVARINAVSARAREAGAPVVLIQHEEGEGPMLHGSAGWQLFDGLTTAPGDLRVRKTACDSFHNTPLATMLQSRAVGRVVVCGLQSEFCVDSTTRGALAHGLPVTLVSDGHSTLDNGVMSAAQITAHHNATLSNIGSYGPQVTLMAAEQVQF
jgi:nicotinamidase-related amidase